MSGDMEKLYIFPGTAGMQDGDSARQEHRDEGPQCPRDSQHSHSSLGAPSRACHHSLALILSQKTALHPSCETQ